MVLPIDSQYNAVLWLDGTVQYHWIMHHQEKPGEGNPEPKKPTPDKGPKPADDPNNPPDTDPDPPQDE